MQGRRKALLFISEGLDYDIHDYVNNRDAFAVHEAVRDTVSSATRANVNIYSIDPRGLTSLGDELIEVRGLPDDPNLNLGPTSLRDELQLSQNSLRILAEDAGGFAIVDSNDISAAFGRIAADNSRYCVLGYCSTNERRDSRFRKIEVRLSRPGLIVRARKGYVAPNGNTSTSNAGDGPGSAALLAAAIDRALPTNGLGLAATAIALKGTTQTPAVAIAVDASGRGLNFARKGGKFEGDIELSVIALDYEGRVRGRDRITMTLELTPDTYGRVTDTGFRMLSKLNLPPGRYQLRVAARETAGGQLGTVFHDLDVPDFAAAPLSMSQMLLTSLARNTVPTLRVDQLKDLVPVLPSTAREFTTNDELILFAEVYDRVTPPHHVDTTATVPTEDGRVVFQHHQESSSGGPGSEGGFGYVARVRLNGMPPGLYFVSVDAVSRLTEGGRATRRVPFRIRP